MELLRELKDELRIREGREDVDSLAIGMLYGMLVHSSKDGEKILRQRINELRKENNNDKN